MGPSDPLVHSAALQQFVRYARTTGIALDRVLDADLRGVVAMADSVETVPATAILDIFQTVAIAARRPDLGVAFAMWCNMHGYGPLSLLWDHCTSVEQSIRLSGRYLHLETEAISARTIEEGDEVAIHQFLTVPAHFGGSQYLEATLTLQMRIIQNILGPQWHPVRMEFEHPAPDRLGFHRSVFRCPLVFEADRSALILSRSDMARTSPTGNAHLVAYIERLLASAARARPEDLVTRLERYILAHLAGGTLSLDRAAAAVDMGPRSLQRALAARDLHFQDLVTAARQRIADQYFAYERKPSLAELAHRLGYAEASAASRFLRKHMRSGARHLARRQRHFPASRPPG